MWCTNCGQDTPGISAAASAGQLVCARCGMPCDRKPRVVDETASADSSRASVLSEMPRAGTAFGRSPTPDKDRPEFVGWGAEDWEHEIWNEDVDPVMGTSALSSVRPEPSPSRSDARRGEVVADAETVSDTLRAATSARSGLNHRIPPLPSFGRRAQRSLLPRRATFVWGLLWFGITILVCGAILTSLSTLPGRTALWSVGLPMVLVGQTTFLIGVYLQLEDVWQGHRDSTQTLEMLERQLAKLDPEHDADLPVAADARTGTGTRPDFVNADVVLRDLKRQLDRVAARMRQLG